MTNLMSGLRLQFRSYKKGLRSHGSMLLPNAVRRFVELYTYAKSPDKRMFTVDSRAERVFGGEKAKRILKTLHYFSRADSMRTHGREQRPHLRC